MPDRPADKPRNPIGVRGKPLPLEVSVVTIWRCDFSDLRKPHCRENLNPVESMDANTDSPAQRSIGNA